jgi:hypothetical protein
LLLKKAARQSDPRLDNGFSPVPAFYSQTYPQFVWKMQIRLLAESLSIGRARLSRVPLALGPSGR